MKNKIKLMFLTFIIYNGSLSSQEILKDSNLKDIRDLHIKTISFSSRSHDWSAFCTFYSNGKVTGSHLSGNPPFIHQDNLKVNKEIINEIWEAALPVIKHKFDNNRIIDSSWAVYETITIVYNDEVCHILWQTNPVMQNPSEEVLQLRKVILKYHIGGW